MKKLSLISVAALMLASCSSDEMSAPAGAGTEQEVSLSFQLPSEVMSRAAEQSGTDSSKGGATNCTGDVTFTVQLSYNGTPVYTASADATIPNEKASVTFRPTLVIGETYDIVAYAQFDGAVENLTAITVDGSINDETVDSYFHSGEIVAEPQMSATLYRPTGKLRIIADDFAATEAHLNKQIESIKVTYSNGQETVFNAQSGDWATEGVTAATTQYVAIPEYTSEGDAKTLMVDYIPAPKDGTSKIIHLNEVEVIFSDKTNFKKDLSTLDVPIKRNYLTTLKGNFFTQEMDLTLQIDDAFETPEQIVDGDLYALVSALENGGTVTLNKDLELDDTYSIPAGQTTIINLNGHTLTSTVDDIFIRVNGGNLVINDSEGTGLLKTAESTNGNSYIASVNSGTITVNGGNFITGDVTCFQTNGGQLNINGGHFAITDTPTERNKEYGTDYLINYHDSKYTAEATLIVIKGGEFVGFNPASSRSELVAAPNGASFVAEGYQSVELEEGVWTVVKGEFDVVADSNEELKDALTADDENISVLLNGDLTYDVAAWNNNALGGANTETITIDGNGHTLTFNQTNGDWNNIVTNGATLIIKNANLTNSGNNNGPWNSHDLNFNCDVELTDVVSDKAIALRSNAKLTNVTIKDANQESTYAVWITTGGQNVTLDGCVIDMTACSDGRGIKIDEQYDDTPSLVTLNVSNTTFKTAKKAAVIVKSKAGAVINWGEGNDISGVKADSQNAVWVDADAKAYYDLVVVNGATKAQEQ